MVFSTYKKQRILHYASLGLKPPTIATELQKEVKAFKSRYLQVPETLSKNRFDRKKSWVRKTIESNR